MSVCVLVLVACVSLFVSGVHFKNHSFSLSHTHTHINTRTHTQKFVFKGAQ